MKHTLHALFYKILRARYAYRGREFKWTMRSVSAREVPPIRNGRSWILVLSQAPYRWLIIPSSAWVSAAAPHDEIIEDAEVVD